MSEKQLFSFICFYTVSVQGTIPGWKYTWLKKRDGSVSSHEIAFLHCFVNLFINIEHSNASFILKIYITIVHL